MRIAQDYSGRHIEGYVLYNDDAVNQRNLRLVESFINTLDGPVEVDKTCLIKRGIDAASVFSFLRDFQFPENQPDLGIISSNRSLFVDYVSDRLEADLKSWDIALPLTGDCGTMSWGDIQLKNLPLRKRGAGSIIEDRYWVTGKKCRVANPGDERIGLSQLQQSAAKAEVETGNISRGYCAYSLQRERPLMLIHIFNADLKAPQAREDLLIKDPVVTLSFCLPTTLVPAQERLYQVNVVYRNQILESSSEADDDEEMISEAENA